MEQLPSQNTTPDFVFDVPPEHIVQSSQGKGWHGIEAAEIVHPEDDFSLPSIPHHVLVVNLSAPSHVEERRGGQEGRLGTGNLVLLPAGAPTTWHLEPQGEVRHLHLYLSSSLIHTIAASADLNPDSVELITTIGLVDPQLESMALSLLRELRSDGLGGKLYTESLATLLGIHLLRHHSNVKQPPLPHTKGLDSTTLKIIFSYIDEHLAEDIALAELASVAHLSSYHFARLFKHATGLAPHQYVIRRRIDRARLLLSSTSWPLTMIAHSVGFANPTHLAIHFKRLTSLTPKQYRAQE